MTEGTTLEQRRAGHALAAIKTIIEKKHEHYISYVSSLPATIMMNGLGQALVTLITKSDQGHKYLYDHVTNWLNHEVAEFKSAKNRDIIEVLMENDQDTYVKAQAEAMAYLRWLKQFARAYLNDGVN